MSSIEPMNIKEALQDADWAISLQEELYQFERSKVWHLVPRPINRTIFGTRWIFKILIAYAAHMEFKLFQMDVKSASLNENLKEEVHVKQPPGCEDTKLPNHVLKLDKALYGLKQAPRAWYERLSIILLANGFKRGIC